MYYFPWAGYTWIQRHWYYSSQNTMLAGSRGAFVNTPCQRLREPWKHPAESPPILLREYVLILSSPIGKAAKAEWEGQHWVPGENKVTTVRNGEEKYEFYRIRITETMITVSIFPLQSKGEVSLLWLVDKVTGSSLFVPDTWRKMEKGNHLKH